MGQLVGEATFYLQRRHLRRWRTRMPALAYASLKIYHATRGTCATLRAWRAMARVRTALDGLRDDRVALGMRRRAWVLLRRWHAWSAKQSWLQVEVLQRIVPLRTARTQLCMAHAVTSGPWPACARSAVSTAYAAPLLAAQSHGGSTRANRLRSALLSHDGSARFAGRGISQALPLKLAKRPFLVLAASVYPKPSDSGAVAAAVWTASRSRPFGTAASEYARLFGAGLERLLTWKSAVGWQGKPHFTKHRPC